MAAKKPKTQVEIVQEFIDGAIEGQSGAGGNLRIKGNQLIHYQTVIAERINEKVILNYTRYSLITGKVQKEIKEKVPSERLIVVGKVEINYIGSLVDKLGKKEVSTNA